MRSRLQQKRRRQSRRSQMIRRGGRPDENQNWRISYEVSCNNNPAIPEISASNLFSMAYTGLYEMAQGNGDYRILGAENIVISQIDNNMYQVKLDVLFDEHMVQDDLNEWKAAYLAAIRMEDLFMNGSFVPRETSFLFESIAE